MAADLLDPADLATALANVAPTHVFITTWMRQQTETENVRVNAALVRNLQRALAPTRCAASIQSPRFRQYSLSRT